MTKQFNSRVAIGTAQFGMNYGIANKTGKLSDKEIKKILNYALLKGIKIQQKYMEIVKKDLEKQELKNLKLLQNFP